jgi:hypothetical protein
MSTSPDCSAVKRCCAVSGVKRTFWASPGVDAALNEAFLERRLRSRAGAKISGGERRQRRRQSDQPYRFPYRHVIFLHSSIGEILTHEYIHAPAHRQIAESFCSRRHRLHTQRLTPRRVCTNNKPTSDGDGVRQITIRAGELMTPTSRSEVGVFSYRAVA